MSYDKSHQRRQQSLFFRGPIDPLTGNYTPSEAEKAGVKQWPKTKEEREKQDRFFRKHS